jgi:hypothetical protein
VERLMARHGDDRCRRATRGFPLASATSIATALDYTSYLLE